MRRKPRCQQPATDLAIALAGVPKSELARKAGVSAERVSDFIAGRRAVPERFQTALLEAIGQRLFEGAQGAKRENDVEPIASA